METIALDYFSPQLTCQIADQEFGPLGYLVIDRTVGANPCGGGIRCIPGLTVEEVAQLARVMTLKFGFLNFPHGGAKAGITVAAPLLDSRRKEIMAAFGRSLGILLRKNVYFTGDDMGTTQEDLNCIQEAVGNPPYAGGDESVRHTALTVFEVIRQAARHRGMRLSSLTAALEGFGKVASELALLLDSVGVKLVAVSTVAGAVWGKDGFDVSELRSLRLKYGDGFVEHCPAARRLDKAELPLLPVDLFIPCARTWSITAETASLVRAKLIVPAANAPLTPKAEGAVLDSGILYMPDFVANCGAVLGSRMASLGFTPHEVAQTIEGLFAGKVARLLEVAERRGVAPLELARTVAWRNHRQMNRQCEEQWAAAAALPARAGALGGLTGAMKGALRELRSFGTVRRHREKQAAFSRFARQFVGTISVHQELS